MKTITHYAAAAFFTAAFFVAVPALQARSTTSGGKAAVHEKKVFTVQDEMWRTLKDVEVGAYDLHDHASNIQAAATTNRFDRSYYIAQLNAVKEGVNSMGKELARLEALLPVENPAERRITRAAKPQLQRIAATTTDAIRYFDSHPPLVEMPDYRKMSAALYQQTDALWKLMHDSVKLADTRVHEQQLRRDLAAVQSGQN